MSKRTAFILLLIFSIFPLLDLFHAGLPITHDGQDHVARIANFYLSLSEGNIIPRWAANLNWGYGHPILMFLYPFPSYIASVFHVVGFSFVDSTKLVFAMAFIGSVLAMYIWAQAEWGIAAGMVAGLLYGFAPYRFVDLYVRGAIGEHVAFVFLPLILYGVFQIAKTGNFRWWGILVSLATAALILSHNAVSLMFLPVIFFYTLYLFFFESKHKRFFVIRSLLYIFWGFMISAFFWMPAFFEGKYTLRDIVTKGDFSDRFTPISWFIYSPWNYGGGSQFTKALGFIQWIGILGSLAIFFNVKSKKVRWMIGFNVLLLVGSLFLMTSWSQLLWKEISLLQKFQFPWRLLTLSVFAVSVLGAVVVSMLPKKFSMYIIVSSVFLILFSTFPMWQAKTYGVKPPEYYAGIYDGTTDTGESSPIWSTRFMERRADGPMEIIEGSANITPIIRKSTRHEYAVTIQTRTRLVENTLYFPGWNVYIDGKQTPIEFQDPSHRGLLTFWIEPGTHSVVAKFTDTKLRSVANFVSGLGIVFLGILSIISMRKHT